MKNLIIICAGILLLCSTLASCEKTETIPGTGTHILPSPTPVKRYLRTNDTEDRPKMVKGHVQNSEHADVPNASVCLYLVSDSSKLAGLTTDYRGAFAIDSIYGGNYFLEIIASGYLTKDQVVTIPFNNDNLYDVGDITLLSE